MQTSGIQKTQVVIVGAGPTGLSMAAQLLRYGIDFIILEKKESITTLSKAIVVQARSLEIFQELGIAEEALKRGQLTTGMNLFYKGKQKLSIDLAGLGKGLSRYTFALSLEQSKTEKLLAEHLNANHKNVQWNSALTYFEEHDEGVTVYYQDRNGRGQTIEADYLTACDGAGSLVRHQLKLSFEGSTEPKLFYVADVILASPVINKNALYMFMIRKGFILFFPMEGKGHYRIVGILPDKHDADAEYDFAEIEPRIKKNLEIPVNFTELKWFSTYKVHSRKANSFMQNRCFIAGDAAHIHTPAGGQGMNTGIQDVYNLAWKIAYVLKGVLKTEVLQTYDSERGANAKHLLQTTDRMFDIMSGVNPVWNFFRLTFLPLFFKAVSKSNIIKRQIFPLLSQTAIAYPDSSLTVQSAVGKVKAGDRMHYFMFSDGTEIFTYLSEPVFKLLYFGKRQVKNPVVNHHIAINFMAFAEIPESIFGSTSDFYILVRPDNHISYIGKEISKFQTFFDEISAK